MFRLHVNHVSCSEGQGQQKDMIEAFPLFFQHVEFEMFKTMQRGMRGVSLANLILVFDVEGGWKLFKGPLTQKRTHNRRLSH